MVLFIVNELEYVDNYWENQTFVVGFACLMAYLVFAMILYCIFNNNLPTFASLNSSQQEADTYYNLIKNNVNHFELLISVECFHYETRTYTTGTGKDKKTHTKRVKVVTHRATRKKGIPSFDFSPDVTPTILQDETKEMLYCRNSKLLYVDTLTQAEIDAFVAYFVYEKSQIDQYQKYTKQINLPYFLPKINVKHDESSPYLSYWWAFLFKILLQYYFYANFVEKRIFRCHYVFKKLGSVHVNDKNSINQNDYSLLQY